MSKLDQAFIRAYAQKTAGLAAPHAHFAGPSEPADAAGDRAAQPATTADEQPAASDQHSELPPQGDRSNLAPPGDAPVVDPLASATFETEPHTVEQLYRPIDAAHDEPSIPAPHARFFTATPTVESASSPESIIERLKAAGSPPPADRQPAAESPTVDETSSNVAAAAEPTASPSGEVPCEDRNAAAASDAAASPEGRQPAFAVEQFAWPRVVGVLSKAARKSVEPLFAAVMDAGRQGQRRIAFAGTSRGAGSTSLLLLCARQLADRGQRVVIVDGDFEHPGLAEVLGLQPEVGWREALDGELPLFDTMIESVDDRLTLLPLLRPIEPAAALGNPCLGMHLDELQAAYDLVLVHCGPLGQEAGSWLEPPADASEYGRPLDAAILVEDARLAATQRPASLHQRLQRSGVAWWGSVHNFAPAA